MSRDKKSHRILGVPLGSTPDVIKAAYHEAIERYHPDLNPSPEAAVAFRRLQEAYRFLCERGPAHIAGSSHQAREDATRDHSANATADESKDGDAEIVVRAVMARYELFVQFGGTLRVGTVTSRGYGPNDEEAWRHRPAEWTVARLHDAVMDEVRRKGSDFSTADISRVMRRVVWVDQEARETTVMWPLLWKPLDAGEQVQAAAMWLYLTEATLDMDSALGIAVLQHFIWQVKRKQLECSVCHHLMPVVVSPVQGSGKTTMVTRFLSPLEELASDPVLLSQLADPRSGEILRFPAVFIDDVERLNPGLIAVLKSLLTSNAVNRRRSGTSKADKRRQRATLIGTANEPITVLIADPTGHRRFVELPFRNGAVTKGGDPKVWQAVDDTDFMLLWRSVDAFGPPPILPHLATLAATEAASAPVDRLRNCLIGLDLRSEDVQAITVRGGGVGAEDLRLLINELLGDEISANEFSRRMASLVTDPAVPFRAKKRMGLKNIYRFKCSA